MIILRQHEYADKDYAGLNMWQRLAKRQERNRLARKLKSGRSQANSTLQQNIVSANRKANTQLDMLGNSDFFKNDRERNLALGDIVSQRQQDVNNAFDQRNQQYDRILGRIGKRKQRISDSYKPNPNVSGITGTSTNSIQPIINNPVQQPQPQPQTQVTQKQGIGTMGKVAIGAGIAATGYGAYRLIKAKKDKKKAKEAEQQKY